MEVARPERLLQAPEEYRYTISDPRKLRAHLRSVSGGELLR
jgi:hypothetical protein